MRRSVFWSFRILALICFWIILGGIGCKRQPTPETIPSSSPLGTIRIGEVGSMTGSDATFGLSTHRGILLAVNEINAAGGIKGRKLELITLDDQGKPSEAVLASTQLITQQRVTAILGEVASTLSIAMASIAQQYKIPMITPSSINSKVTQQGNYVFRVCFVDRFQSQVMAEFALNHLHVKRAAILEDVKSDYSRDSATLFSEIFKKGGGEIVINQSYSAGDVDFKSQLTAIRGAKPDLLLVPGYYTEMGLIARQAKELGMNTPMLGGDGWDSPKLVEIGGSALNGSFFVSHFSLDDPSPLIQKFIQKYKSTFGVGTPDGLAALGYDATRLLADGMRRAKTGSSEDLREAIASTRGFPGVTGTITMGPDRNAVKPAVVFELVEGGKLKTAARMAPAP